MRILAGAVIVGAMCATAACAQPSASVASEAVLTPAARTAEKEVRSAPLPDRIDVRYQQVRDWQQAQALSNFDLLEPTWLPPGYALTDLQVQRLDLPGADAVVQVDAQLAPPNPTLENVITFSASPTGTPRECDVEGAEVVAGVADVRACVITAEDGARHLVFVRSEVRYDVRSLNVPTDVLVKVAASATPID